MANYRQDHWHASQTQNCNRFDLQDLSWPMENLSSLYIEANDPPLKEVLSLLYITKTNTFINHFSP